MGKVLGTDNKYGAYHQISGRDHFNFGLSYEGLAGYLEGAFAMRPWNIEIGSGIPSSVRGGTFPAIHFSKIDSQTLDNLLVDAGIKSKLQFAIRLFEDS